MRRVLDFLNPFHPGGIQPRHLGIAGFIALVIKATVVLVTLLAGALVIHHYVSGGFRPGPLPAQIRLGGSLPPSSWSLGRSVVRVHNQGTSNSCVGQTVATITEIEAAEFGAAHKWYARHHRSFRRAAFSAGYVWNQINGGSDSPTTYNAAFGVLQAQGDAPLRLFSPDGASNYWVQPGATARHAAVSHRIRSWRSISSSDWFTIEKEIRAGHPIALAIPVYASFLNNWTGSWPVIAGQYGVFEFDHSITIIGYNPTGVVILNSWGPSWGYQGRATLTWGFLRQYATALIVSSPRYPHVVRPAPYPIKIWGQFRREHHKSLISNRWHGKLSLTWKLWRGGAKHNGGIVAPESWHPRPHGNGFVEDRFQGYTLVRWVHHPHWAVKWIRHRWVR